MQIQEQKYCLEVRFLITNVLHIFYISGEEIASLFFTQTYMYEVRSCMIRTTTVHYNCYVYLPDYK